MEIRLVTNASQASFDKVTLDYVPLPPSLLLLGSGLVGAGIPGTPEVLVQELTSFFISDYFEGRAVDGPAFCFGGGIREERIL